MSDKTPKRVVGRPFQPGNPGRPKGSRNRLNEAFVSALYDSFVAKGPETIETVRVDDPSTYMRVIASILPKEITGEDGTPLVSGITVTFVRPEPKEP